METIIDLMDITKKYDKNTVLDIKNLSIKKGELVSICGNSGTGKTTLFNIIGLLEKPTSGLIKVFGHENPDPNSKIAQKILRNHIGYIFQNYALIDNESVFYNLEIALTYVEKNKREKLELIDTALSRVGLNSDILHQKVYKLSGGEQQRASIARLLLKPCELILADEPTASLDEINRNEIMNILTKLNDNGKTILIVTHDSYVAEKCHRSIELKKHTFKRS